MLSARSRDLVADSLPAVGAVVTDITRRFYRSLFDEHPELLDHLFNRGNQANGEQQNALASALVGFASLLAYRPYIRPEDVIARIAHKHASVGITPEQYGLVHHHLMRAFSDVLGPALPPAVAAAWDEVYWLMADSLVAAEARLYASVGAEPGLAWRRWRVVLRVEEALDVVSLHLEPVDGAPPDPYTAGQYVTVASELPDGAFQLRQYSLSSAPEDPLWRITVRRSRPDGGRPAGEVSSFLHDRVGIGSTMLVSPPYGEVVLDDSDAPLLFASSGIGATPLVGMLRHLSATGSRRPVTVVHADRSAWTHPLRFDVERCVRDLGGRLHVWYEDMEDAPAHARRGPVDLTELELPSGLRAYLCGPGSFTRELRPALVRAGVAPKGIRHEVFGPDLWQAPS
ncbi:globin domain-containing protein [Streptacidiphilus sp. ASG 303]|uniref:globin domain-containing protein n=1 Tax=Streptacidiphilus sp. ASG 303 TaxID=2896847 RepID=UPI001E49180F|nr:globin domain-containing protein [Streptacidiphilus sp. ASG 303]MCD0486351.1 globin domain-containing protein [Streptacidiphilus sp. ASG 303]